MRLHPQWAIMSHWEPFFPFCFNPSTCSKLPKKPSSVGLRLTRYYTHSSPYITCSCPLLYLQLGSRNRGPSASAAGRALPALRMTQIDIMSVLKSIWILVHLPKGVPGNPLEPICRFPSHGEDMYFPFATIP
ncbi:hypothetical protein L1887_17456 [Cichorium endivia]|nr:hypothetical protein L1887_17456 [Cichorium endivia]